jgi:hypothetical protein
MQPCYVWSYSPTFSRQRVSILIWLNAHEGFIATMIVWNEFRTPYRLPISHGRLHYEHPQWKGASRPNRYECDSICHSKSSIFCWAISIKPDINYSTVHNSSFVTNVNQAFEVCCSFILSLSTLYHCSKGCVWQEEVMVCSNILSEICLQNLRKLRKT